MRSCPLRLAFEASSGYPGRVGYAARIGTAFHRTMEWLAAAPVLRAGIEAAATATRERFLAELATQNAEADRQLREQALPHDSIRVDRALEAAMAQAVRLAHALDAVPDARHGPSLAAAHVDAGPAVDVEVGMYSADGLLYGRIDRAERTAKGTRLVDFKSALRDDLPERYERQLQLYAALWHETRREWPVEALVVYPIAGSAHPVSMDPIRCQQVADEARALIAQFYQRRTAELLATPGDVCMVCAYRPWCRPFWRWQATARAQNALAQAGIGFEGEVLRCQQVADRWALQVHWQNTIVRLFAPVERFPHLAHLQPGQWIRVVDALIAGQRPQPLARVGDYTEIFLLQRPEQRG